LMIRILQWIKPIARSQKWFGLLVDV
jgi:hypothetical protein